MKRIGGAPARSSRAARFSGAVAELFRSRIPFNRVLGVRVLGLEPGRVEVGFRMRKQLVGNFMVGSLHGGVISAVLDATGGLAALMAMLGPGAGTTLERGLARFEKLGTIDLRVDYLRPGLGKTFVASASILRAGRRVTVTRMELRNEQGKLLAVGTGTYIVS